jgi:hypothetical protein
MGIIIKQETHMQNKRKIDKTQCEPREAAPIEQTLA